MRFTFHSTWKDFLRDNSWGLEIIELTNENNADKISELWELRSVGTPIAGVSPTKQMPEALVEQTMLMNTRIWARNLSLDPFYLAIASKSNIVDNKY